MSGEDSIFKALKSKVKCGVASMSIARYFQMFPVKGKRFTLMQKQDQEKGLFQDRESRSMFVIRREETRGK